MVVETVTASEVMGDSANVDDVVPAVMSDTVVSVAERRYIAWGFHVQGSTYRRALGLVKSGLTYREWRENEIEAGGRVIYCSGSLLLSPFFQTDYFSSSALLSSFAGRMIE